MRNNRVLEHLLPTSEVDKEEFFRSVDRKIQKTAATRNFKPVILELRKYLKSIKNSEYRQQAIETAVLQFLEEVDAPAAQRPRSA